MEVNLKQKYYNVYKRIRELQDRFEELTKADPSNPQPEVRMEIARLYMQVGEVDNSVGIMSDYVTGWLDGSTILNSPLNVSFFMASILSLYESGRRSEAVELLNRLKKYLSETPELDPSRGYEEAALFGLKQAMNANANILSMMIEAEDATIQNDGEGMLDSITVIEGYREKNADKLPPDFDISLLTYYGEYHFKLDNVDKAIEKWMDAAEKAHQLGLDFRAYELYRRISGKLESLGEYQRAIEYYEKYRAGAEMIWAAKEYAYAEFLIAHYGLKLGSEEMITLAQQSQDLGEKLTHDTLTRVYNRRFLKKLNDEGFTPDVNGMKRVGTGDLRIPQQDNHDNGEHRWCAIMLDIDYFKEYNDCYGHLKGDRILSVIGGILNSHMDEMTYPIRYGGEEFLILVRNRSDAETTVLAREILRDLRSRKLIHTASKIVPYVTMSAGVAGMVCEKGADIETLIGHADQALYTSKHRGRNRCTLYRSR